MFGKKMFTVEDDKEDRKVQLVRYIVTFINGETVNFTSGYHRYSSYERGIVSYKKMMLLDYDLTINNTVYNSRQIFKIDHVILDTRYIKREIREKLYFKGGIITDWNYKRTANEDELEEN